MGIRKFFVYDPVDNDHDTFDTFEEAEKHLKDIIECDADDGLNDEYLQAFIGKVSHVVEFSETDSTNNYPCGHGKEYCSGYDEHCPTNCDEEEWPHSNDFDYVSDVIVKPIP